MRYTGQGHEIAVPLPVRRYAPRDAALLRAAFEAAYRALYSRAIPGVDVEVLSWVTVVQRAARPAGVETPRRETPYEPAPKPLASVFDPVTGEFHRGADLSARGARAGRAYRRPGGHRRGRDLDGGEPALRAGHRRLRLHSAGAGEGN